MDCKELNVIKPYGLRDTEYKAINAKYLSMEATYSDNLD